ncbi:hypothetical protein HK104_010380 [Borealophlyctis nickersoniae]|nr:hypothetical protein HK104_010380 [Borealophlyctis nickersoniae]
MSVINTIINFVIISLIVYFIVKLYTSTFHRTAASKVGLRKKKETPKHQRMWNDKEELDECAWCCRLVPVRARKCCFCGEAVVVVEKGEEDVETGEGETEGGRCEGEIDEGGDFM